MNQFLIKFNRIFIPFLIIAIANIGICTFLHWLLFIKIDTLKIDEEVINFWVPIILPGIPILIWLRPRIKLLNLKNKSGKGDPLGGYIFIAWIMMAIPIIIAQEYIVTATGKLTNLDNISQINTLPKSKYYAVNHFYVDKRLVRPKTTFSVSGKYNQDFDITLYVPCPVFDKNHDLDNIYQHKAPQKTVSLNGKNPLVVIDGRVLDKNVFKDSLAKITPNAISNLVKISPDSIQSISILKGAAAIALYGIRAKDGVILITTKKTASTWRIADRNAKITPLAWIALKYQETINNKLSVDRKNDLYRAFLNKSQKDFDNKSLDDFYYLDRIAYSSDLKNYTSAINSDKFPAINGPIIVLSPVYETFESRNGNKLAWIFITISIGSLIFLITLLFKPLREDIDSAVTDDEAAEKTSTLDELKLYFVPRKGFYITPIIIDLNLLVFIIMVCCGLGFISFTGPDLLKWGANYRPLIDNKEYWRLLTSMFLHGGLLHVLFNMYGLLFVGIFLEPVLGSAKYLMAYLITGLAGSIASVWWHTATVSVGASGAIFGMYGVFFALLTVNLFPAGFKKSFLISTSVFIVFNLVNGLTGGIDNAAHIGGLASGLLLGYMFYPALKDNVHQATAEAETQQMLDELSNKPNKELSE